MKKYAAEKQWKTAAERLKLKEKNKPSTPKKPTDLHPRMEELQKELNRLQVAPQPTEEGDSEEEAKAKEAEAAETREPSEKTR